MTNSQTEQTVVTFMDTLYKNDVSPLYQAFLQVEIGEDLKKVAAAKLTLIFKIKVKLFYWLKKFYSSRGTKVSKGPWVENEPFNSKKNHELEKIGIYNFFSEY